MKGKVCAPRYVTHGMNDNAVLTTLYCAHCCPTLDLFEAHDVVQRWVGYYDDDQEERQEDDDLDSFIVDDNTFD